MTELILHHYDESPFSEKIRLVLGWKQLAWRSVIQPNMMPKPQLLPLTGGYRRIPVLQVGADVYCDSLLVASLIERLHPEPTLFPAGSEGLAFATSLWADRFLFMAAVPVLFSRIGDVVPKPFLEDRTQLLGGRMDFAAIGESAPLALQQLRAHAALLERQLGDGRHYLLGESPSLADFSAVHTVWFLRRIPPTAASFDEFPLLLAWADRLAAIGHGQRSEMDAEEALAIARDAAPAEPGPADSRDPNGFVPGDRVSVVPDDYGFDPVEGELVSSDARELAVLRRDPDLGEIVVHFPRAGFQLRWS